MVRLAYEIGQMGLDATCEFLNCLEEILHRIIRHFVRDRKGREHGSDEGEILHRIISY